MATMTKLEQENLAWGWWALYFIINYPNCYQGFKNTRLSCCFLTRKSCTYPRKSSHLLTRQQENLITQKPSQHENFSQKDKIFLVINKLSCSFYSNSLKVPIYRPSLVREFLVSNQRDKIFLLVNKHSRPKLPMLYIYGKKE